MDNPGHNYPRPNFLVKPIHLAAVSAGMILLDRRSGLNRSAREIEALMVKLGRSADTVTDALAAVRWYAEKPDEEEEGAT